VDGIPKGIPLSYQLSSRKGQRSGRCVESQGKNSSIKSIGGREVEIREGKIYVSNLKLAPNLRQEIGEVQKKDANFQVFKRNMLGKAECDFREGENEALYFHDRICVLSTGDLRKQILEEAHKSKFAIYPGEVKMYQDLKKAYWWLGMKKDIIHYISTCLTYQRVKAKHKKSAGLLQPLIIPEWKWEKVTIDFVTGLPTSETKKDAIWVIVDRLTKSAHFIQINVRDSIEKLPKPILKNWFDCTEYHQALCPIGTRGLPPDFGTSFKSQWEQL
jgi:hypothetical protein